MILKEILLLQERLQLKTKKSFLKEFLRKMRHNSKKIDIEEDSEDELAGDELEASMDAFLLEYFAEEH